ncbi:MAG: AIM24 family protein [Sandaracinaceae bacterium]
MPHFEIVEHEGQKLIKATIQNETIRAESGALHYMFGQIEMTSKAPSAGGFLKSMVSGENVFKPTYTGTGEIHFGPPIFGEYLVMQLNNEEWILDQGAYVCSDMGIEVDVFRNKALTGLVGGEGLFQTKVRGTGTLVLIAPGKIQTYTLQGHKLAVDGNYAIARSASLDYSVQRASKSLVGSFTSGEGLLNVFQGTGTVLLAPVPNLYQNLINQTRYIPQAGATSSGGNPITKLMSGGIGKLVGLAITAVVFVLMFGCSILSAVLGNS